MTQGLDLFWKQERKPDAQIRPLEPPPLGSITLRLLQPPAVSDGPQTLSSPGKVVNELSPHDDGPWLGHQDLNLDSGNQNPESCRWTMSQCCERTLQGLVVFRPGEAHRNRTCPDGLRARCSALELMPHVIFLSLQ